MVYQSVEQVSDAARAANPSTLGVPEGYQRHVTDSGLPKRDPLVDVFDANRHPKSLNELQPSVGHNAEHGEPVAPQPERRVLDAPYVGHVSMSSITGQRPADTRPRNRSAVKRHRSPEPFGGLFRRGRYPRHLKR